MNHQIPQLQTEKKNKFNFIKLYKTYRMKKINNNKIEIVLIDIFNETYSVQEECIQILRHYQEKEHIYIKIV